MRSLLIAGFSYQGHTVEYGCERTTDTRLNSNTKYRDRWVAQGYKNFVKLSLSGTQRLARLAQVDCLLQHVDRVSSISTCVPQ
eukprot:6213628-Amphidinium_carterae.1